MILSEILYEEVTARGVNLSASGAASKRFVQPLLSLAIIETIPPYPFATIRASYGNRERPESRKEEKISQTKNLKKTLGYRLIYPDPLGIP